MSLAKSAAIVLGCIGLALLGGVIGATPKDEPGVRAVDGDTVKLYLRLAGVDAPELHGRCDAETALAKRAQAFVAAKLAPGRFTLTATGYERYGRLLGTVTVEGEDLGEMLIAAGLARRWTGRREPWCP